MQSSMPAPVQEGGGDGDGDGDGDADEVLDEDELSTLEEDSMLEDGTTELVVLDDGSTLEEELELL